MTKELLDYARKLEVSSTNPDHERGARLLQGVIANLMAEGFLPDSYPFSDTLDLGDMGLERLLERPTHSRFTFDNESGMITNLEGEVKQFTPTEKNVFSILLDNMGSVVTKEDIIKGVAIWGNVEESRISELKSYVKRIRRKLDFLGLYDEQFPKGYILTLRGGGYGLFDPSIPEHVRFARANSTSFSQKRKPSAGL